jgi:hypothetical protein
MEDLPKNWKKSALEGRILCAVRGAVTKRGFLTRFDEPERPFPERFRLPRFRLIDRTSEARFSVFDFNGLCLAVIALAIFSTGRDSLDATPG